MTFNSPIKIIETRAWRTYIGGALIEASYNRDRIDNNFPEEWIASCVQANNPNRKDVVEGLSTAIINGKEVLLKDLIEEFPEEILGKEHVDKYGSNQAILTKVIDSLERLTIQCHPTKKIAKQLFSSDYGKAEAWLILGGREIEGEKPYILFGFKKGVSRESFI